MKLNTYLRWIALAAVFSVFLVPFIVSNGLFFPFITGKAFFFRTVVEIGFAAWLLLSFRDTAARPRKSILLWSFIVFVAVIALADLFGENSLKSFWSNFERMEGYITLLHLFIYFIVASSILAAENLWKRFFEVSVWSSLAVSLYGILQISGVKEIHQGGVRVDATFGNATYLAIFLVFNIFFACMLAWKDRLTWKKISFSVIALLDLSILYFTATRGAILGLIGGLFLSSLLIALFDRGEKKLRIIAGSVVGAVILVVLGFIAVRGTDFVRKSPVLSRFASISLRETKTQARAYIWPMAIEGWKEKPILGWGQENFNYVFNKDYDPRMYNQEQWFDHAHNTVLDWLVAGGILGLLAYLSLFASALYLLWKKSIDVSFTEKSLLTGLLAAYFFHNLFVFDNLVSYILFASVLGYIHFRSTRLEKPVGADAEELDDSDMRVAAPVILVALVIALYFFNWRGYETGRSLIGALISINSKPIQAEQALVYLEKAYSYGTLGKQEVVERVVESARLVNVPEVSMETRQKYYDFGSRAVEEQTKNNPNDARREVYASNFYVIFGNMGKALEHMQTAVALSPRKQTLLFQLGSDYALNKEYEKSVETFKKAYDLEPSNEDALKYYAASLIYVGKESEAKSILSAASGGKSVPEEAFLSAYIDMKRWDKVISIFKAKVAAEPNVNENRVNLAYAYYEAGNKAAAISTIRDVISRDPSFKAQGEQLISQIQAGR